MKASQAPRCCGQECGQGSIVGTRGQALLDLLTVDATTSVALASPGRSRSPSGGLRGAWCTRDVRHAATALRPGWHVGSSAATLARKAALAALGAHAWER